MRQAILSFHRRLSVVLGFFWILQAITGVCIVFHWEIRDAQASTSTSAPTNFAAIGEAVTSIAAQSGSTVSSVWTTAGLPDRYKVNLANGNSVRIGGDGTVLASKPAGERDLFDVLLDLHHTLLAGESGKWIVGASGILLTTNLLLGLRLAWPKEGLARALWPKKVPSKGRARLFTYHRTIGLWAVIPAIVLIVSGTLLRFEDQLSPLVSDSVDDPSAITSAGPVMVDFETATRSAIAAVPGSRFAAVSMPGAENATYRFRLLEPGELRKAYGTSVVWVDARDGSIRAVAPASGQTFGRKFLNALFALHTGEAGGILGRILTMAIGLWLVVMIILGVLLWSRRRRPAPEAAK